MCADHVDDLGTTVADKAIEGVIAKATECNQHSEDAIKERNAYLNKTKAAALLNGIGEGSIKAMSKATKEQVHPICKSARYLCPDLDWNCSSAAEVDSRISAAHAAFWSYAQFWRRWGDARVLATIGQKSNGRKSRETQRWKVDLHQQ